MRTIYQLFGKSPFDPLVAHTRTVHAAAELVRPLFEAFTAGEWARCEEIYARIADLEHEADVQKDEIRDHLPKFMFLPVDRGDVLRYVRQQDSIADCAEDLAMLVTLRKLPSPEPFRAQLLQLVEDVVRASELLLEAGSELPSLYEASFGGPEVDKVLSMVKSIANQESKADHKQHEVARALLACENGLDPTSITVWMHIIQVLGKLADHAENAGDVLRAMMARR
ncbi:MAG: TIGR00153 family protein [Gemmatimonadota bacterium]